MNAASVKIISQFMSHKCHILSHMYNKNHHKV